MSLEDTIGYGEAKSQSKARDALMREYERLAPKYDAKWPFYIEATTRETMARLDIRNGSRVLDVGCGTGALLYRLSIAHPQTQLFGIDPSPAMLAVARQKLPPAVELREGWGERIPFDDQFFDAVVCCNVFHYVQEALAAIKEMTRVLRPGGQLVITDWCDDYLTCRIYGWWLRRFGVEHVKIYRAQECLELLKRAGHADAQIERYKINRFWGLMTAKVIKKPREP